MIKYHDANGQLTPAGKRFWHRAAKALKPLINPAKNGWEAKEREMIIEAALSSTRVLKSLYVMRPLKKAGK